MESGLTKVIITVEYQFGGDPYPVRETFMLKRDLAGDMRMEDRKVLP